MRRLSLEEIELNTNKACEPVVLETNSYNYNYALKDTMFFFIIVIAVFCSLNIFPKIKLIKCKKNI